MRSLRTSTALQGLRSWTPSQLAALGFGYWWTVNGIAALIASDSSLSSLDARSTVEILGMPIAVNGWHVVFHLTTGLVGLAVCASPRAARAYAYAMAALYAVVSVWGFVVGSTAIGAIAVNTAGTTIHLVETIAILAAAIATEPVARQRAQT